MYVPILRVIHCVVWLTTGPQSLPKCVLHKVRSSASYFNLQYPLFTLRSSSSSLRLLPCLSVTCTLPCIFPSITRFRMTFLRKMWPIQLVFILCAVCKTFLSKYCSPVYICPPKFLASKWICFTRYRIDSSPYFKTKPEAILSTKGNNNVAMLYSVNLLSSVSRRLYKSNLFHIVADCTVHCYLQWLTTRHLTTPSRSGPPFGFPATVQDRYMPVTLMHCFKASNLQQHLHL